MPKKVMIVDDSATMRQLVQFTLNDAGYDVTVASSGEDALDKAEKDKFSLVIADLNMPGINGIEMVRTLRTKTNYRFTPIIMLTTESRQDVRQEAIRAGATCWLIKPFQPSDLMDTVKRFVK